MPPLQLNDDEMSVLMSLAQPIPAAQRSAFLDAVATAIGEQAGAVGIGSVHRTARQIQRQFWDPPALPNQTAAVHRGSTRAA